MPTIKLSNETFHGIELILTVHLLLISGVQMKSWAGKALETVSCFALAFLKCKKIFVFSFYIHS
jgi:hypothetical protein